MEERGGGAGKTAKGNITGVKKKSSPGWMLYKAANKSI